MATQVQIAEQMLSQLKAMDPAISGGVGTPERMIIDTVAQTLAEAQIDLNVLQGALDVDAKIGTDLDNFLSLFGFGRQLGSRATGFVTFARETATTTDVSIPLGTQVVARRATNDGADVIFYTTTSGILAANSTEVVIPVSCSISGTFGNVAANTITEAYQTPIIGITSINNPYATANGTDRESDDDVKARFKATGPFRNLSGTESQYLATAISTLAKKAIVVGPISRQKEYIQVPLVDDASLDSNNYAGNGLARHYTTALSFNKNAKYVYNTVPYFAINETTYPPTHYRQDLDYVMNFTATDKNCGDAYREYLASIDISPLSTDATNRPNVTFLNVWTGDSADNTSSAVAPGDIVLNEYSYLSLASRNDYERGILNCVDIYVNNNDNQNATAVVPRPGINVPTIMFNTDSTSAFYIENFRRIDEPEHRPVSDNIFTPLFHQPSLDLPNQISISDTTYYKNIHYWAIQDVTDIGGTIRARNGIEWSSTIRGAATPEEVGPYSGHYIVQRDIQNSITHVFGLVDNYVNTDTTLVLNTITGSSGATVPAVGMSVVSYGSTFMGYITAVSGSTLPITITLDRQIGTSVSGSNGIPTTFGYPIDNAGATSTIIVPNSSDWPSSGTVVIDNEHITYSGIDTTGTAPASGTYTTALSNINSVALTGLTRKTDSTAIASHAIGANVNVKYNAIDSAINIDNYTFDNNIPVLQSALEGVKQVTTDVLAHKARVRYFKPDVTVMFDSGMNQQEAKESIRLSLLNYFESKYFGNTIQLSDILQVIHNTAGVDNVKWSKDLLSTSTDASGNPRNRLSETSAAGDLINGVILDQVVVGGNQVSNANKYNMYLGGNPTDSTTFPTSGTFVINYGSTISAKIDIAVLKGTSTYVNGSTTTTVTDASSACTYIAYQINRAYDPTGSSTIVTVVPSSSAASTTLIPNSLNQFVITYVSNTNTQSLSIGSTILMGGLGAYNTDFVLQDNELATLPDGKTVNDVLDLASIITVRVKSQSTWNVK